MGRLLGPPPQRSRGTAGARGSRGNLVSPHLAESNHGGRVVWDCRGGERPDGSQAIHLSQVPAPPTAHSADLVLLNTQRKKLGMENFYTTGVLRIQSLTTCCECCCWPGWGAAACCRQLTQARPDTASRLFSGQLYTIVTVTDL